MKGALDKSGSESQHDGKVIPSHVEEDVTQSPTVSFPGVHPPISEQAVSEDRVAAGSDVTQLSESVNEHEKTIISQRPVAAPEEFYKSMPLADLAAMLEGKQLDHFAVEQMIGGGGMGAVFRGRDQRLDRTVAIKVIPASKRDPEMLRRFRLEAQAAARLDHPNIARVYYVGEAEQWNYIVFEFIDGVNIRDLVSMEGPLSVDDAVYYTRQVAEALQHAHDRDVVHRDIKPSNLLVTAGGIAKVVDMGLARSTSMDQSTADATASGITLGTFDYISPEQARDPRDADVRSDLYSLGCTLFFMLTGHPPFPEGTALQKLLNHGSLPPPDPRGWREDLSDQLYAILMKLMAKQPGNRYQKPAELINDLILLADIEDLPRSQTTGTILFTPSIAQRSLLESNLPWMVAFAFLLGSTLWLQSVPALSNGFSLPELRFENSLVTTPSSPAEVEAPDVQQPTLPQGPSANTRDESSVQERLPEEPIAPPAVDSAIRQGTSPSRFVEGPIVVSELRPADVEAERWTHSLHRATQQLQQRGGREIEVRGRVVLDRPWLLDGTSILLRSDPATRSRIVVAPALLNDLDDWSAAIELKNSTLDLIGVDLWTDVSKTPNRHKVGLIRQAGNSALSLNKCLVTIKGDQQSSLSVFAVLADEEVLDKTSLDSPALPESNLLLTTADTVIRGDASFLGLRIDSQRSHRVEISSNNSLVAIGGVVLDVVHSVGPETKIARSIRLFCEESTYVSEQGFAVLDYSGQEPPVLSLNRTSNKCVYDSGGADAHVVLRGLSQDGLPGSLTWLLLKGIDNAYDDSMSTLCRCYNQNDEQMFAFGFNEASQDGWFAERGNEQHVRWSREPAESWSFFDASPTDFKVREGMFSPGIGELDRLPPF